MNRNFSCHSSGIGNGKLPTRGFEFHGHRPNQSLELTAMEHRGSAKKGKEEFALSGLGKRLLAAVQVGR
jgi:hypothetical protein